MPLRLISLAMMAMLAVLSFSAGRAAAQDAGKCPGVDTVEGDLKQSSSSGYFIPGLRLIILNRTMLEQHGPVVSKFIFAHECAHADPAVGMDESAADCAAAERGVREGWLGKPEIIQVCAHLARMPADATHPPVAARCANIRRCSALYAAPAPPAHVASHNIGTDETPLTVRR